MGLQLVNAVLLTWGFWHPQYGGSLSALLPARPSLFQHLRCCHLCKMVPGSRRPAKALLSCWCRKGFFSLWDQAFCFIRQWSWLSALCRIQPGSCSSSAGCFSRRTRTSLQGEAMRQQRNDAAPELSMGNTMLVTVGWGLLYGLDCWWLCTVITGPDYFGLQGNAVNGREFGSACVFSCWWTHKELFAVRV